MDAAGTFAGSAAGRDDGAPLLVPKPKKKKKKNKPGLRTRLRRKRLAAQMAGQTFTEGAAPAPEKKPADSKDAERREPKKAKRSSEPRVKKPRTLKTVQESKQGLDTSHCTVCVNGLNFETTELDLIEHFKDCDEIEGVSMPKYKDTNRNRGFAFVKFSSDKGLFAALEKNQTTLMGRYLKIEISTAKKTTGDQSQFEKKLGERPEMCRTVGVFNLAWSVDEAALRKEFGECGDVFSARIVTRNGRSQGYGYVEFASMDSVDKAIELTGRRVKGRPIRVDFAENSETFEGRNDP